MTEALIVDPGLRSVAGHHYNAACLLRERLEARGVRVRVLASRFATRDGLAGAGAEAVFTNNAYSRGPFSPEKYARHVQSTLDGLTASVGATLRMPDLIILPTCDAALAEAVGRFLMAAPVAARPPVLVWLLLSRDFARMTPPEEVGASAGYGWLTRAVGPERLHVFAETPAMADIYKEDFERPIGVAPSPAPPIVRAADRAPGADGPRFSSFGHIVDGKGYALFPDALAQAAAARPDLRFTIHAAVNATSARKSADLLDAIDAAASSVTVLREELTPARYAEELGAADAIMLPYDPRTYGDRGSGIFNESVAAGIPILATDGCSFAAQTIAEGRGVAIAEHTSEALAAAILDAAGRMDALRAAAVAHAAAQAEAEAAALDGYLDAALAQAADDGEWASGQTGAYLRARALQGLRALVRFPLMLRATRNARRVK